MLQSTKSKSAAQKEKLFVALTNFIIYGCEPHKFSKTLPRDVVRLFGFDASLGIDAFKSKYLATPEKKTAFIEQMRRHDAVGNPEQDCSDLEAEVVDWIRVNHASIEDAISVGECQWWDFDVDEAF